MGPACSRPCSYRDCGTGSFSNWCRCGYCEAAWAQAKSVCAALYYANGGHCGSGQCCDYSQAACVDIDQSTSSSSPMMIEGEELATDSTHWGPQEWSGVTPVDEKADPKILPTIFALSAVGLIGVLGAVALYVVKRKRAAVDLANLTTISEPNYASTDASTRDPYAGEEVEETTTTITTKISPRREILI